MAGLVAPAVAGEEPRPAASDAVAPGVAASGTDVPAPEWGPCPDDVVTTVVTLECATVPVPLDHDEPEGEQIELMISKLASPTPEKRRGILLLDQGGPGQSGLAFADTLVSAGMPATVLEKYDLISMDTRGVGHSAPVGCGFTVDDDYLGNIPPYAKDDAAVVAQAETAKEIAGRCAANDDNGHLRHVSTENRARDLDRIRAALGEEKASFLGYSYGSGLGAAYASLFPERTDRVVLDSNIGDTHLSREGLRRFALGAEDTFPDFATWAAARHETYGLGATPEEVRRTYFRLAERLDETPAAGVDGRIFRLVTYTSLFGKGRYGLTAQVWQSVRDGDGPAVRELTTRVQELEAAEWQQGVTAQAPGLTASAPGATAQEQGAAGALSPSDNAFTVWLATTCNDVEWPHDVAAYRKSVAEDRVRFPLYGAASANIFPCAFWPYEAEGPVAVNTDGPANILVTQNRRDPVTPQRGGEVIAEKFGDRARLVSADESGHGTYVLSDNACALGITTSFLVDGTLPKSDVNCPATP